MKKSISRYSLDTFTRRFGGWRNSLHAFLERVDSEHQGDDCIETSELTVNHESTASHDVPAIKILNRHLKRTPRNINLRMRFTVLQRDNFACTACTACGALPSKNAATELNVDHIFPWSKGGETELNNLQTLCAKCNLGKSNN
jgi:5-methylcytosine-specific restriction endonuclease McrA